MKTKAELIRKISKTAGVPDMEAKVFFEILLKKISENLKQGEALHLKELGFLQLMKGKIKASRFKDDIRENDYLLLDIIVYKSEAENNLNESLIFSIPADNDERVDEIESFFSLSIGKPVIPLHGVNADDFFIPLSGGELNRLLESKAEKIIAENDIIEMPGGDNVLTFENNSIHSEEVESGSEKKSSLNPEEIVNDVNSESNEGELIPWDFGENLSKLIEEESLLDTSDLSAHPANDTLDDADDFQQVKTQKSEFTFSDNLSGTEFVPGKSFEAEEIDSKDVPGFKELKPKHIAGYEVKKSGRKSLNKFGRSKDSSKGFYITLAVIILIGAGFFFYKKVLKNEPWFEQGNNKIIVAASSPVIINRSYEIPVTYPYLETFSEASFFNPIDENIFAEKTEAVLDESTVGAETKNSDEQLNSRIIKENVKGYIYKYNDFYVVQVSSWQAKSRAENHAESYRAGGYSAYVESTEIQGRGTWYRVRIGNFTSVEEAEKFLNN
jgi:hypothetical protein